MAYQTFSWLGRLQRVVNNEDSDAKPAETVSWTTKNYCSMRTALICRRWQRATMDQLRTPKRRMDRKKPPAVVSERQGEWQISELRNSGY